MVFLLVGLVGWLINKRTTMVFLFIGLAFGWLLYNAADELLTNTGQHLRMVLPMIMRLLSEVEWGKSDSFLNKIIIIHGPHG